MIIRLIRDEKDPDAELAAVARAAYKASVLKVISKLPWKDFEQLIDLILARTGYLGNEALQRVILRQGNEAIKLTILVSLGGINPDADEVNERAAGDYLATLVSKAGELSANHCGEVTILHLQRGDGLRPAL
jgi:hypothetical protein